MAIVTYIERMTGSVEGMTVPIVVHDDGQATVSESTAVTTAQAAAPANVFGTLQDGNPGVEKLADHAWRISITYRVRKPRKLTEQALGEVRYNVDLRAKRKVLRFAPEVARFPGTAPTMKGMLTLVRGGNSVQPLGVTIDPPAVNARAETMIATSSMTSSFAATISSLVGRTNSVAIGTHAIGEVFLGYVTTQMVDDDRVKLTAGWALGANVTGEARGDVNGIAYQAFQHVWELTKPEVDRNGNTLAHVPRAVYVNDVWPSADLTALGMNPP